MCNEYEQWNVTFPNEFRKREQVTGIDRHMNEEEFERLKRRTQKLEEEVSTLRAANDALRRDWHRAVVESAVDFAIIVLDSHGMVRDWNHGAERILDWTAGEMIGRLADVFFTPEDKLGQRLQTEMHLASTEGRAENERWHLKKDGSRFWASGQMMPLINSDGLHDGYVKILRDRTQEHLAGQELQAAVSAQQRYRDVLASTEVGFCILELIFDDEGTAIDYRFIEANSAFEQQTGLKEAAGRTANELIPELELYWVRTYAEVAVSRQPVRFEHHSEAMDRWFDVYAFAVDEPKHHRVALLFNDLTARRETEEALRQSEARFRTALEIETVGALYFDMDGKITDANAGFLRMSGYTREDLEHETLTWQDLTPPEWLEDSVKAFDDLRAKGQTVPYEKEYLRKDGSRWWGLFAAKLLPGNVGFEFVLDITDHKKAQEALQELNASLERRVEERTADRDRMWRLSTDIMLVADFEAKILAVNPAWTSQLGWSQEELLKSDFLALVHPDDLEPTLAEVHKLSEGRTTLRFENRYRQSDGGYRWVSWTAVPDEQFIHAVGRDVQAEKDAEEALRTTEDALRQSQKMEAVGQLTGGIAHDFNNLLSGISGSLELINIRLPQRRFEDVERYAAAALGATKRAAALTHRLLAFSRRQTLDPKPTDVNHLIDGLEDLVRRTVGPQVGIEVMAAADLWPILVDPNQLENAILNLCINARDAMPEGGRITIGTSNRSFDKRGARQRGMDPGDYVCISVSDTGTGMAEDVLSKVFEPFFTTKPMGMGTGLGLSMIYGFIRQSGGQVRMDSIPGSGTTAELLLPRHLGEQEDTTTNAKPADAPRAGAGETVLVVDDEPMVRMLVVEVLEDLGYAALEAEDGASGLEILQSDKRIDLLVSDVGLPGGINGRQMADAARQTRKDLKVLFITGYAEKAAVGNGDLEAGMHVMTKPFAIDALATRIKQLIAGG
jgi:PAS domain S-box-containing protein